MMFVKNTQHTRNITQATVTVPLLEEMKKAFRLKLMAYYKKPRWM